LGLCWTTWLQVRFCFDFDRSSQTVPEHAVLLLLSHVLPHVHEEGCALQLAA
jgi:hypothetical protein